MRERSVKPLTDSRRRHISYGPYGGISLFFTSGSMRADNDLDPRGIGMKPISLVELGIERHPVHRGGIEDHREFLGKLGIDGVELRHLLGPQIALGPACPMSITGM